MKVKSDYIFVMILVISMTGCASTHSDFKRAQTLNTIHAYQSFVRSHPDSEYASQATEEIAKLTRKKEEAERLRQIEREQLAYRNAIKSDSITELKEFLSIYPESAKHSKITTRIAMLEKEQEEEMYQLAIGSNSYDSLQRYVKKYPTGRYYNQVKQQLDSFSWSVLRSPTVLPWSKLGLKEPLTTDQLSDHIKKTSLLFQIKGFLQGGGSVLVMPRSIIFTAKDAEVEGWGKVPPSAVFLSQPLEGTQVFSFDIKEGTALPQINMETILAVGSLLIISKDHGPVNLYGHHVRHGTIKVISKGLELQSGTEVLDTRFQKR